MIYKQNQYLTKNFLPGGNLQHTGDSLAKANKGIKFLNANRNTIKLVEEAFSPINALASKPIITVTANSIIVYVFYYFPEKGQTLNNNIVNKLAIKLQKQFQQHVELRLKKHEYPYLDRYILAQYIAVNTQQYTFDHIASMIIGDFSPFLSTSGALIALSTNSFKESTAALTNSIRILVGIKLELSGRLVTELSRPRETVQIKHIGSFAKDNSAEVQYASFTTKNKKGAFTIKVTLSLRTINVRAARGQDMR